MALSTRVTRLFGIQHPIILPGMSWISTPRLVAAVSNAGGLGILATGNVLREIHIPLTIASDRFFLSLYMYMIS